MKNLPFQFASSRIFICYNKPSSCTYSLLCSYSQINISPQDYTPLRVLYAGTLKKSVRFDLVLESLSSSLLLQSVSLDIFSQDLFPAYCYSPNIKFSPNIQHSELLHKFFSYQCLLYVSSPEYDYGSPVKLSEYLISGLPIISYPHPILLQLSVSALNSLNIFIGYEDPTLFSSHVTSIKNLFKGSYCLGSCRESRLNAFPWLRLY